MKSVNTFRRPMKRRGAVSVLVAVVLVVLVGFASLTIDVGHMYNVRSDLQDAADAASLAVAVQLSDDYNLSALRAVAEQFANTNHPGHGNIVTDLTIGSWDQSTDFFTPWGDPVMQPAWKRSEPKRTAIPSKCTLPESS